MVENKGIVFDILRCSITDGPGIRTTVFLKGCPLHCAWCHNPESQHGYPELMFDRAKCLMCGKCFSVCKTGAHKLDGLGNHYIDGNLCKQNGDCAKVCITGALEMVGETMSVSEVMKEILPDLSIYTKTQGGVTISGGEPMFQPEFTKSLLKECKKYSIHTCLDTSGYAPWDTFLEILDSVDIFLYDIKETDTKRHEEYTGVPFEPILENLKLLDDAGGNIVLRCPIIPGLNNRVEHINAIVDIAMSLKNLVSIECLNYHSLGIPKLEKLGRKNEMLKFSKEKGITFDEVVMILFSRMPEERIKNAKPYN